jgi:hypothetical protein
MDIQVLVHLVNVNTNNTYMHPHCPFSSSHTFFFFSSEVDDGIDCVFDDVEISIGVATTSSQSEELRSWYAGRFAPLELSSPAIFSCR